MILHLSLWKDYRERNLISFCFPFRVAFMQVNVLATVTCVICFTGKIREAMQV